MELGSGECLHGSVVFGAARHRNHHAEAFRRKLLHFGRIVISGHTGQVLAFEGLAQ